MHALSYQVAVIGSGAGGARAALLAARRGVSVLLVEKGQVGGDAMHAGTLPIRSLTACARMLRQVQGAERFGVRVAGVEPELVEWINRQRHLVTRLVSRLKEELRAAGVVMVRGRARLLGSGRLCITEEDGARNESEIRADQIILATGTRPRPLGKAETGGAFSSSHDFVSLAEVPKSLFVIGGGHVGCEFAGIYNALGAQITLIEKCDRLLPDMDPEAGERLAATLLARGVDVRVNQEVRATEAAGSLQLPDGEIIPAREALLAVGRQPNVADLGLDAAGVSFSTRGIEVDHFLQTSAPGVSAIGDVTGLSSLADSALAQARVAVENALGGHVPFDASRVPRCVHTDPAVADVGLDEAAARAAGHEVRIGRGRCTEATPALSPGESSAAGFIKLVADAGTRRLLGGLIVGERAAEWIGELSLGLSLNVTVDALLAAPRAHVSFAEALETCAREMFG